MFNTFALITFQVEIEGLTGDIRFDEDGRRVNYTISVVEMSTNSAMIKVADWTDEKKFVPLKRRSGHHPIIDFERNRTYVVTTILEEPYIMERKTKFGEKLKDDEKYVGYCKDLADKLAEKLDIQCE